MEKQKIVLNPSSLQPLDMKIMEEKLKKMEELAKEEEKRFSVIADKIIGILIENSVLVKEVPNVMRAITEKINPKIDSSLVKTIIEL